VEQLYASMLAHDPESFLRPVVRTYIWDLWWIFDILAFSSIDILTFGGSVIFLLFAHNEFGSVCCPS